MALPVLPPAPIQSTLANGVGLASPSWVRWFQLLGAIVGADVGSGGGSGTLSNAAPQNIGTTSAGVGTEASRDDHVHGHGNLGGGSLHALAVAAGAAGFLSGTDKTKLDGLPGSFVALTSSSPADVGTTAVGVAATAARADHVHGHGNLAGGSLHAVAVGGVSAGFISSADQTKLDNLSGNSLTVGQVLAFARSWPLP